MTHRTAMLALAATVAASSAQEITRQVLAQSPTQAPGLPMGVTFADFTTTPIPLLSDTGTVAFVARLAGPGVTSLNDHALFATRAAAPSPALMARTSQPAPNTEPGITMDEFRDLSTPMTGDALSFRTTLEGSTVPLGHTDWAIYTAATGVPMALEARYGQPIIGLEPDTVARSLYLPKTLPSGAFISEALLAGPTVDSTNSVAMIAGDGNGTVRVVARKGDQVISLPQGVVYDAFWRGRQTREMNESGVVVLAADIVGPDVTPGTARIIVRSTPTAEPEVIARTGEPVVGLGPDVTFLSLLSHPSLGLTTEVDADGNAYFLAELAGPGIGSWNDETLVKLSADGVLTVIAREGNPAPGFGPGVIYGRVDQTVFRPNDASQLVMCIPLLDQGRNRRAILRHEADGTTTRLAAEWDEPIGLPDGVTLDEFEPVLHMQINDQGQVVYGAYVIGAGVGSTERFAVFTANGDGSSSLIVRRRQPTDFNPDPLIDDIRTPNRLAPISSLNNAGQLAMGMSFTDGTEALVLITVPAPPCSPADLALPLGQLSFADINAFLTAFVTQNLAADLAAPTGDFTFADVSAFLTAFTAGCP